jgi:AcrR family transcriptional regulator
MQLTRRHIIAVATTLIERDGAEAFSMTALATELGCGVLALYGYIPSRSDVLDCVAGQILTRVAAALAPRPVAGPSAAAEAQPDGWQDQIRALAAAMRQVARAFPRCATLAFVTQPEMPDPAAEAFVALRDAGLSGQDARQIVRTLTAYVIGSTLCELGADQREPPDADADFEFGLGLLIRAAASHCPASADAATADLAVTGAVSTQSAAAAATGRATPAPAASTSASRAGRTRAADKPAALAMPPMSTGPPSMPA